MARKPLTPPPFMSGREFARLIFLLVALVVVLGMFFMFPSRIRRTGRRPGAPPSPPARKEVRLLPPVPREKEPSVAPSKPVAGKSEEDILASIVDQKPIEPQPYYYLLQKIANMTEDKIAAAVKPGLTPTDCLVEPKKHRGEFLRVVGTLKRFHRVNLTNKSSGFDKVYEGTIVGMGPPGEQFEFCTIVTIERPALVVLDFTSEFDDNALGAAFTDELRKAAGKLETLFLTSRDRVRNTLASWNVPKSQRTRPEEVARFIRLNFGPAIVLFGNLAKDKKGALVRVSALQVDRKSQYRLFERSFTGAASDFASIAETVTADVDLMEKEVVLDALFMKQIVYVNRAGNLTLSGFFIGKVIHPLPPAPADWRSTIILGVLVTCLIIGYVVLSYVSGRGERRRRIRPLEEDAAAPSPESEGPAERDRPEDDRPGDSATDEGGTSPPSS